MVEEDTIKVIFERIKTGRIDKIEVNVEWFKHNDEYKSKVIHSLISEIYRKVFRDKEKEKQKTEGG